MSGLSKESKKLGACRDSMDGFLPPRCFRCGATRVAPKGFRKNKRGKKQRWHCLDGHHRFTVPSILDALDWDSIDLLICTLVTSGNVEEAIQALSERGTIISRTKVMNAWKYVVALFNHFESNYQLVKVRCTRLQIDDMYQRFENNGHYWIITVFEEEGRRWLVSEVTKERGDEASLQAMNEALRRCHDFLGKEVLCDGHGPHIKAINSVGMIPNARTKNEDFAHINLLERVHRHARDKALKKKRRFRSYDTLQLTADLIRQDYNFLKRHKKLNGLSPVHYSTGLGFRKWSGWIRYIETHTPLPRATPSIPKRESQTIPYPTMSRETKIDDFRTLAVDRQQSITRQDENHSATIISDGNCIQNDISDEQTARIQPPWRSRDRQLSLLEDKPAD